MLPLPLGGVLRERLALGLALLTPLDVVVRGRILYAETPQFLLADRAQSVAIQAAMGVDIGHGLRVGGGVSALAALLPGMSWTMTVLAGGVAVLTLVISFGADALFLLRARPAAKAGP